jgi:2-amino-4-hydroxy-6-hydroxymethyldihydropteridine diphosphokinase
VIAYIGLGTNLGNRWANLRAGVLGLRREGLEVLELSSVWESEPVGTRSPLWFLNMAARARTTLGPRALLDLLLAVERAAGRRRGEPNAPRTLDLDLLMLDALCWSDERLELPHPRMWQRRFVLEPLGEIAPELCDPATGRSVEERRRSASAGGTVYRVGRLEEPVLV